MSFNKVIPYTSSVGSKFLINFSDFQEQEFSLPVVDVSLVLAESVEELLSLKDLVEIVRIIIDFLNDNQVVLYYYCDSSDADIFMSVRNKQQLPQEFRHNLFNALFSFMKLDHLIKDEIIISDPINSTHYISLITKIEDKSALTEVSIAVQQMDDK